LKSLKIIVMTKSLKILAKKINSVSGKSEILLSLLNGGILCGLSGYYTRICPFLNGIGFKACTDKSLIKGKDTKPEMLVRRFLFGNGFMYRVSLRGAFGQTGYCAQEVWGGDFYQANNGYLRVSALT
jgi:hypothetical protein